MKRRQVMLSAAVVLVLLTWALLPVRSTPAFRGRTIAEWAVLSVAPEAGSREEAAATFRALGTNAVPDLIRLLRFKDAFWRKQIWAAGPKLPSQLTRLGLQMAGKPRAGSLHAAAARSLAVLGPEARPAIPALVKVVYGTDAQARYEAALTLGLIGKPAVPALTAALDHMDPNVRGVAISALSAVPPADIEAAIPTLLRAMVDSDEGVRAAAHNSFSKWGPALLPSLTNALEGGDKPTRHGVARALPDLHTARSLAARPLLEMVRDPDATTRREALQSLGRLGLPDSATIEAYAVALKDPDPEARLAAVYGLNQCRSRAGPAVPALTDSLSDVSPKVREWAARVLGAVYPPATSAVPQLSRLLEDPEAGVRRAAREALARVQSPVSRTPEARPPEEF